MGFGRSQRRFFTAAGDHVSPGGLAAERRGGTKLQAPESTSWDWMEHVERRCKKHLCFRAKTLRLCLAVDYPKNHANLNPLIHCPFFFCNHVQSLTFIYFLFHHVEVLATPLGPEIVPCCKVLKVLPPRRGFW